MVHLTSSCEMRWWAALDVIEEILEKGGQIADEVEVFSARGTALSLSLKAEGVIDTSILSHTWGLGIRTIQDGRIGFSSTSDPQTWKECLGASLASGRVATQQSWKGLPPSSILSREAPSADATLQPNQEPALLMASELLEGASEHTARVTGGSVDLFRGHVGIRNTQGLDYQALRTRVSVSLETIQEDSTGYEFDASPFLDVDPRRVGERAAFLAEHGVRGEDIETGEYGLVLSPLAVAQLIGHVIVPALSGRNVHAGRSRWAESLGKEVMDPAISLYDDPFARGLGSTERDSEGTPARRIDFLRDGVLECFAYDLKTGYRYGEESTGSAVRSGFGSTPSIGVHNLILEGDRTDVLSERALYVHDVVGAHTANPLSGDFSVECSNAYWVEGGEAGTPVRKAMYAGNVFDLLRSVGGLGKESRIVGSLILPPVKLYKQRIIGK
jgi:PmbA protein